MTNEIIVKLPEENYPIVIGEGVRQRFSELFKKHGQGRAFWLSDKNIVAAWDENLGGLCSDSHTDIIVMPPGEEQKQIATIERVCQILVTMGAERGDTLVACGGGVVGDIGGFAASVYLRGIPCVQIPTTLLAMVDSSIGGKTGVDLPEGKNLIGSFHQPAFVLIDVEFLKTLNGRQFRSGFAEVVKTALIGDASLYRSIEQGADDRCFQRDAATLIETITACVKFKADIVAQDEKEAGLRRNLNFGHTIGHALEALGNYAALSHGEAVFWGMTVAVDLSVQHGSLNHEIGQTIHQLLERYLKVIPAIHFRPKEVMDLILNDKKTKAGKPHFVLLEDIGKPIVTDQISNVILSNALEHLKHRMKRIKESS
ncbi:3-dehydroquinate synthase [bacterium]|nr:3-dehydroquinate synthase [bacterium]MBU1881614.1 3-dehydroquinate synthase [bacterium]